MNITSYSLVELSFAFRCYVYLRWQTHRNQPVSALADLSGQHLQAVHPEIHLLEFGTSPTEVVILSSLRPTESVSTAASKLKGAASKSIRELSGSSAPEQIFGGGYFAATTGVNNSDELDRYLERQGVHHGYANRVNPPVWVQAWKPDESEFARLQTRHAICDLRWHIVLCTWNRSGAFTQRSAKRLCELWEQHAGNWRIHLQKVSVVPDHIHMTVRVHATVKPAELVLSLLNSSQDLMKAEFSQDLIRAGGPRLWKPSAYIGTFGDLKKDHLRNYVRKWERDHTDAPRLSW